MDSMALLKGVLLSEFPELPPQRMGIDVCSIFLERGPASSGLINTAIFFLAIGQIQPKLWAFSLNTALRGKY